MFQVKGLELRKTKAKSILPVQNHGKAKGITNHPLHPLAIGKESVRHFMHLAIIKIISILLQAMYGVMHMLIIYLFIALFPPQ